jgi:GTP-binding protein Era
MSSDLVMDEGEFPEAPPGYRSGFVPLIGRSNVGKSTLLNRLVGQKVSIVSPVAQTTRNRIQAILSVPSRGQIVFLDTPGIHKPRYRLNRRMVALALESLSGTDVILFMADASTGRGSGDDFVLERLRGVEVPVVLLLNKVDRIRKDKLLPMIDSFQKDAAFAHVIPISALDGTQCDVVLERVLELLPEGSPLFPADSLTDQPERFLAAEIVREKLLHHTREEIPHALAVRIETYQEEDEMVRIEAVILVDRDSQKGIVIGKGGSMLKQAGTEARLELERLLASKVFLQLFVRVERGWRQNARILDELGVRGPER